MQQFEDMARGLLLTDLSILERVDEYDLFCHYLGFQPQLRTSYHSPIRLEGDKSPSFSIFSSNKPDREYFWKDSGGKGESGDIFQLIRRIYGYNTFREVLEKIDVDFKLGYGSKEPPRRKVQIYDRPVDIPAYIRIKSKPITEAGYDYWNSFGIIPEQLKRYQVKAVDQYWITKSQLIGYRPRHGLCFAYQILDRYQLYQPFAPKGEKFRHSYTEQDLHGFHQLQYKTDTLIITKARKDVMVLDNLGFDAVAPRSENTPVANEYLRYLETKYPKIITLFDNDEKCRPDLYPYPSREVPASTGCKDPAEFRKQYGAEETINLIQTLIL